MRKIFGLIFAVSVTAALTVVGCGIEEPLSRVVPEEKPRTNQLNDAYKNIEVGKSSSADVLSTIKQHDKEIVSQSKNAAASWGEKKDTYQFWLNMAAFDEDDFTVSRKYFLAVDEKPWHLGAEGQKFRFDSQMLIDRETLNANYTSQNQKQIAILEKALENIRDDFASIRQESRVLAAGGMMINQTFERILYVLRQSPSLAEKLDEDNGLDFDHLTLGKSRVQMKMLGENTAVIKIKSGNLWRIWNKE